jgi:molecular chaperone GrpE
MEENQASIGQDDTYRREISSTVSDNHSKDTLTVETPAADTLSPNHEGITPIISTLLVEMQGLKQDFETKIQYDESKDHLIDTLHKELQSYREGLHFKILRPIFIDLISMYDDLHRVRNAIPSDVESQELQNLQSFQETIEEILHRNGVDAFVEEEDIYIASKQRILKTSQTSDPTLDRHIARRVRKGFVYDNKLLRPEIVEIYKYALPSDVG